MPEDLLVDGRHTRSDLRRMEHALSTGWKIPDAVLEIIPARLLKIMSEGGHREQIAAARVLVAMHGQNMGPAPGATIQVGVAVNGNSSQPDDRRNRTLAIAERIRAGRVS
jgi:hypothetical protein